jgi:hypothetical protein
MSSSDRSRIRTASPTVDLEAEPVPTECRRVDGIIEVWMEVVNRGAWRTIIAPWLEVKVPWKNVLLANT